MYHFANDGRYLKKRVTRFANSCQVLFSNIDRLDVWNHISSKNLAETVFKTIVSDDDFIKYIDGKEVDFATIHGYTLRHSVKSKFKQITGMQMDSDSIADLYDTVCSICLEK